LVYPVVELAVLFPSRFTCPFILHYHYIIQNYFSSLVFIVSNSFPLNSISFPLFLNFIHFCCIYWILNSKYWILFKVSYTLLQLIINYFLLVIFLALCMLNCYKFQN
jgi:hypothetical protein